MWYRKLWEPEPATGYRILSVALAPLEWLYASGVALRDRAYERNWLQSESVPIRTLAVGNLTVGGTGKTPLTAWLANDLRERGRRPAIVLRGYGGDEVQVHRQLNPDVPVYATPDRVAGARQANADGCDIAVLDDAFQHRAIRRDADIVLIATEDWTATPRLLPRGPWREPLSALRRASIVIVVRKTAAAKRARDVAEELVRRIPGLPTVRIQIGLSGLARLRAEGTLEPARDIDGFRARLGFAGVARPELVRRQLEMVGAQLEAFRAFPDHHRYDRRELDEIRRVGSPVVTTLKDAVKVGPKLAESLDLYVALQEIRWESGRERVESLLEEMSGRGG